MVLRLWVSIRVTTRSIRIIGEETLGMSKDILDETSPLHGSIPVPPVMGAQIDLIVIRGIQAQLSKTMLSALSKVILLNNTSVWFTIYLCIFIWLHNCAMLTRHDAGYARKHGIQVRHNYPELKYVKILIGCVCIGSICTARSRSGVSHGRQYPISIFPLL